MINERKNILVLSAGRRVELVQSIVEQRDFLSPSSKVIAVDTRPELSAACQVADQYFKSPRVDNESYSKFIFDFCAENDVGLVIPTIDTELPKLSLLRTDLEKLGSYAIVSGREFVEMCRDKRLSAQIFSQIGVRYPKLQSERDLTFPVFAKPFNGSSSIGARLIGSAAEMQEKSDNLMYMEYIGKPFVEYTVDCYFDKTSMPRCVVPRLRIETRAGEVSKGITQKNEVYEHLRLGLHHWQDARGCITIQVFFNPETRELVGLEVNPRFGGGFPLTYAAGGNYVGWLIKEYILQQSIDTFSDWREDLMMLRYDAKVLVHNVKI